MRNTLLSLTAAGLAATLSLFEAHAQGGGDETTEADYRPATETSDTVRQQPVNTKPGEKIGNPEAQAVDSDAPRKGAPDEPRQQPANLKPGERIGNPNADANEPSTTHSAVRRETESKAEGKLFRDREVINAQVESRDGTEIGRIADVLFDENSGEISYALIRTESGFGLAGKLTAVPWDHLKYVEDRYRVKMDKAMLSGAPSFDRTERLDENDSLFRETSAYYGMKPMAGRKLVKASEVIGAKLFDQTGKQLGKVDAVLVQPNAGKVAYGIVEFDRGEMRDKLTAVPWNLIRESKEEDPGFILRVSDDKIKSAPVFEEARWPDYNAPDWDQRVDQHFEVRPDRVRTSSGS